MTVQEIIKLFDKTALTNARITEELGISESTVYKWRSGARRPKSLQWYAVKRKLEEFQR
jgi:DNA-binding transcriptional regulator YiaG